MEARNPRRWPSWLAPAALIAFVLAAAATAVVLIAQLEQDVGD